MDRFFIHHFYRHFFILTSQPNNRKFCHDSLTFWPTCHARSFRQLVRSFSSGSAPSYPPGSLPVASLPGASARNCTVGSWRSGEGSPVHGAFSEFGWRVVALSPIFSEDRWETYGKHGIKLSWDFDFCWVFDSEDSDVFRAKTQDENTRFLRDMSHHILILLGCFKHNTHLRYSIVYVHPQE